MSEIPADILQTAESVWETTWESYQGDHDADPIGVIARAIQAERKRCALVAIREMEDAPDGEEAGDHEWAARTAVNCAAGVIADRIMNPGKKRVPA